MGKGPLGRKGPVGCDGVFEGVMRGASLCKNVQAKPGERVFLMKKRRLMSSHL